MSGTILSVVMLLAWHVLAGSAVAGMRLGWRKGVTMALIWAAIFGFLTIVITAVRG